MAAALVAVPFRIDQGDKRDAKITEKIIYALKYTGGTITRIRLTDEIRSETVLQKADLWGLNEMVAIDSAMMVWKAKACMDPIGSILFATKSSDQEKTISTMSMQNLKAKIMPKIINDAHERINNNDVGVAKDYQWRVWKN